MLYAVGEVERLTYEVKHSVSNESIALMSINNVIATKQYYRMTYVPSLLLLGLLSTLIGALVPLVLIVIKIRTRAVQSWRDVNALRLVIDSAEGLCLETEILGSQGAIAAAQEKIAKNTSVRYSETEDINYNIVLRTITP
jgi:hypothetical protein